MHALLAILLLAATPLHQLPQEELHSFITTLHATEPHFEPRLHHVLTAATGTPYAPGPLGEGKDGAYDTDPLVDFTQVDCVTFIEQSLALAAAPTYELALKTLQRIRYRDSQITFQHRNHSMLADWIPNNPFCRDVTPNLGVPTTPLKRTIDRKGLFRRAGATGLSQRTTNPTMEITYIPSSHASLAQKRLPSPALICFIGKKEGLFALHCGLYIRNNTGPGLLYHASSKQGHVATIDLPTYLKDNSRYLGFTAHVLSNPYPLSSPEPSP